MNLTTPPTDTAAFDSYLARFPEHLDPCYIRPVPCYRGDLVAVMGGAFHAGVEQGRAKERYDIVSQLIKTLIP